MRVRRVIVGLIAVVIAATVYAGADARERRCLGPLLPCPERAPAATPPPDAGAVLKRAPAPLDIGLTERDPRLLVPAGAGAHAARNAIALRPRYIRILVSWARVQPVATRRPNWDAPPGGCPPAAPSCRSALGLRSLLQAIKQRQHADGGWEIVVVPFWTPRWAVARPVRTGCERPGTLERAHRPLIAPYRRFLRSLQALGDKVGVKLDTWLAWNEPNHPAFLSPQRRICDPVAKPIATDDYALLARAAAAELRPDQQLVGGGLAGLQAPRTYGASAPEFLEALPHDVACLGGPFAQHVYLGKRARRGHQPRLVNLATAGAKSLIDDVDAALQLHGCRKQLWIAETGTFDRRCQSMAAALREWALDPRVDAAFQYTFRDSEAFPVGLVSATLGRTYGAYWAWRAYANATAVPLNPCG